MTDMKSCESFLRPPGRKDADDRRKMIELYRHEKLNLTHIDIGQVEANDKTSSVGAMLGTSEYDGWLVTRTLHHHSISSFLREAFGHADGTVPGKKNDRYVFIFQTQHCWIVADSEPESDDTRWHAVKKNPRDTVWNGPAKTIPNRSERFRQSTSEWPLPINAEIATALKVVILSIDSSSRAAKFELNQAGGALMARWRQERLAGDEFVSLDSSLPAASLAAKPGKSF